MLLHIIGLVFASLCKSQVLPSPEQENKSLGFVTLYICLCLTLLICMIGTIAQDLEEAFGDSDNSDIEQED